MGFSITGYVLEPPRVGQSNSPYTSTPNNFISDQDAFNAAYPSNETSPRDDYLVLVTSEGVNGLLINAKFGWTKNEIVQRFDYDGKRGRFRPLPGGLTTPVGVLGPTSNTQRLTVTPPFQALAAAPYRLSIGSVGSGTTQVVSLVRDDASFGSPPAGTTELSLATGHLNWNPSDLTTYNGQAVRWQQQQYFTYGQSTGKLGLVDDAYLLLNPIPGTGQFPLIRIGFNLYLLTVEVPDEGSFTTPPPGTVQWALSTGRLNFNPSNIASYTGQPVYYDGTLLAKDLTLPRQTIGTVNAPSALVGLPPQGGDVIFVLPNATPYYQFPSVTYVLSFDATGQAGTVQVNPSTGGVQFSAADVSTYGAQSVEVVFGDLAIEHGVSMRFFRSPVDLDAQTAGVKDVTNIYTVAGATWASPIIGSPQVFLPSNPIDDGSLVVSVNQAQGTYTGQLPRLDIPSPPAGLGYIIDFEGSNLQFAQRKNNLLVTLAVTSGAAQLPDTLVLQGNASFALETAPGTNVFTTLAAGVDYLLEATAGVILFTSTEGVSKTSGSVGGFVGITFTDTGVNLVAAGVQAGDYLVVETGYAKGVYTIVSVDSTTSLTTDVAPPSGAGSLAWEILRGEEVLADRFFQPIQLTDPTTSVERIRVLGNGQNATTLVPSANATFPDFVTLTDLATDFVATGVQVGDTVVLTSGPDSGTARSITGVAQHTLTVASSALFTNLSAQTYSVYRRLHIPLSDVGSTRIRFGKAPGTFSTSVNAVANDANFTAPGSLAAGVVEVSQVTGNLNFSSQDIVGTVPFYGVRRLQLGIDYQVQPALGLIQFTQRLLTNEEVLLSYVQAPPVTDPPTPPSPPFVGEQGTFLVRKELTQPHPLPTNVLSFNPTGKTVATTPASRVFRGGRPQVTGTQVFINATNSTITFLPDNQLTDALPHGATVSPNENVYIDYFIYEAMGGEKTLTVLNPPMLTAQMTITGGTNSVVIAGDQTSNFPVGYLLRVEQAEVYRIGSSTYNATANQTTITLSGTQQFQNDYTNPHLYVASGPTPNSYFVSELQAFDSVSRGMNQMTMFGDHTGSYPTNTIILFTDGLSSFTDLFIVSGSTYDPVTAKTTVTFNSNAPRQYLFGQQFLSRSVRPIFDAAPTQVQTSLPPILSQPYVLFRRVAGQAGQIVTQPADGTITDSGLVTFAVPLQPNEEFAIFYTGHWMVEAGSRLQASYTSTIVPTQNNGLLGQVLNASYTIYSPDTFYYRVETMTNFKGEVQQAIQAKVQAGSPSSGPMISNASQPQLFDQGRESVFFQEGHLANEDIIARTCLKFFNDAVNALEDVLHDIDGRVVGDRDGRFTFDGVIGRTIAGFPPVGIQNQIDDLIQVSPFPLLSPPLVSGTFQQVYQPGIYSRFFTTQRNLFATSPALVGSNDGDVIAQFNFGSISSLPQNAFKRWPRAQIQFDYEAGTSTFVVDSAVYDPNDPLQRPSFVPQMHVVIQDSNGTFYVPDNQSNPTRVTYVTDTTITVSPAVGRAIPAGATIYMAPSDANTSLSNGNFPSGISSQGAYGMLYPFGKDVGCNQSNGQLLYITRKFPFDGFLSSLLIIPKTSDIFPVLPGDILEADGVGLSVTSTAPYKFPALFGGTTDDDGNQTLPIIGPTFDGEVSVTGGGALNTEVTYEASGSSFRAGTTTPPFTGTGSLDATKTIITLDVGTFPAPLPKQYDLVRILSGVNGATLWRRATSVTANSITIDIADAFGSTDVHFSFAVAVSASAVTGTCTLSGTTLTDSSQVFVPSLTPIIPNTVAMVGDSSLTANAQLVHPVSMGTSMDASSTVNATVSVVTPSPVTAVGLGWTVVMTSGPNTGLRRQVVAVADQHDLVLDSAFPSATGGTYRIDNPLNTYNGPILTQIKAAVAHELSALSTRPTSELNALLSFFTTVFTTVVGPSVNGASFGTTFTDATTDFLAAGVTTSDLVYVHFGSTGTQFADMGVYQVAAVVDAHTLTLTQAVPSAGTVTYEIVSAYGVGFPTLQKLFGILSTNVPFIDSTTTFQTLLNTTVPVLLAGVADAAEYANGLNDITDDLGTRYTMVSSRLAYVSNGSVGIIERVLKSSDHLYNKRYTWIDARINMASGYLALEQQAVAAREAQQQAIVNQLIKLLTLEAS